jgi:hypothetical protein
MYRKFGIFSYILVKFWSLKISKKTLDLITLNFYFIFLVAFFLFCFDIYIYRYYLICSHQFYKDPFFFTHGGGGENDFSRILHRMHFYLS